MRDLICENLAPVFFKRAYFTDVYTLCTIYMKCEWFFLIEGVATGPSSQFSKNGGATKGCIIEIETTADFCLGLVLVEG